MSTQQKLEKVSEALKDLSAQSVDDSVVSPAVSSTVSVKKKVEAASSKIEESSVVLAAGVLLAESFEESRSSVGCKLNDYDSVFGLLSDDVGDDGVVLSKQADEIKVRYPFVSIFIGNLMSSLAAHTFVDMGRLILWHESVRFECSAILVPCITVFLSTV